MSKKIIIFILSLLLAPSLSLASIDQDLYYGMYKNSKVTELQTFLISQGFMSGQATGNFYSVTLAAVKKYQKSAGIKITGYVGPLTRSAINKELSQSVQQVTQNDSQSQSLGQSELSITYPAENTSLTKGQSYNIQWSLKNIPAGTTGNIFLYSSSYDYRYNNVSPVATIAKNVLLSDGKLSWAISKDNIIPEGQYNIGIFYSITSQYNYTASSSAFNIQNPNPKITITSPTSGAHWVKGRTYKITWSLQDMSSSSTATISFLKGEDGVNQSVSTIAEKVLLSAGQLSWVAPDVYVGDLYKIRIVADDGTSVVSDSFNIDPIQPKITITYPTSSSSIVVGKTYTITWTYQDISENTYINISLLRDGGSTINIYSNVISAVTLNPVLISSGKLSWTVPTGNIFRGKYAIYIKSSDNQLSGISDLFDIDTSAF